jgi:hypothetical protein
MGCVWGVKLAEAGIDQWAGGITGATVIFSCSGWTQELATQQSVWH